MVNKDEIRQQIISAAISLSKEVGWGEVSLRKIGKKIDYTAPILYSYFKDKDDLLNTIVKKYVSELIDLFNSLNPEGKNPLIKLVAFAFSFFEKSETEKECFQLLIIHNTNETEKDLFFLLKEIELFIKTFSPEKYKEFSACYYSLLVGTSIRKSIFNQSGDEEIIKSTCAELIVKLFQ